MSVRLEATVHGEPYHWWLPEITVCGERRSGDPATVRNSPATFSGNLQTNTDSDTIRPPLTTRRAMGSSRAK